MTSIHPSSQKFNKLEWIQQKIEEIRKECGTVPPTRVKLEMSSMLRCADGWLVR